MGFPFLAAARTSSSPSPQPAPHPADPRRRTTPYQTADGLVTLLGLVEAIACAEQRAIIRSPRTLHRRELAPHNLATLALRLPPGPEAGELRFWLQVLAELHGRDPRLRQVVPLPEPARYPAPDPPIEP